MAVTLSWKGDMVAGTTVVGNNEVVQIDTTAAQAVTLPSGSVPVGYKFWLVQDGANAITIAADTGETLVGDSVTAADNTVLMVIRSGATQWTGADLTALA